MLGQGGLKITKLLLQETGSYNPQYRRPYNTNLTGSSMRVITERLGSADGYVASAMAGIANQFIAPVATPEKQIEMVNGWNERRMRFMMEVVSEHYAGGKVTEVILGYTSHNGIGINGAIDPRMEFYVNSTIHLRETVAFTPTGNRTYVTVSDSSHILVDNQWTGINSAERIQRMRPEDVYVTMGRTHLTDMKPGTVYDGRAMLNTMAVKSKRSNASASSYMASVIKGYNDAAISMPEEASSYDILNTARGNSGESLVTRDPFLSAMANIRGAGSGNLFTFGDVKALDPNVEFITRAQLMAPTQLATVHRAGQTSDWGASDLNTVTATILSNAVSSLLMELALTRVVFKSTNRVIGSTFSTVIADAQGFSSGDISRLLEIFIARLENEILRDVTYENSIDYALEMHVDLLGETWIKLSLNCGPEQDFVTPSFCDALLTPVITNDDTRAMTLASDFDSLTSSLIDDRVNRGNASKINWSSGAI